MQVVKSRITGYCHGVDKTIHNALYVLREARRLKLNAYSIGNLIHNEDVVAGFERQGLKVIKDSNVEPGVALIRAHGLTDREKMRFLNKGFILVDSTCLNIVKTQGAIINANNEGRTIVVIGVKDHAETNTLLGTNDFKKYLASCVDDLPELFEQIPEGTKIGIAVQTTFPEHLYESIRRIIIHHYSDVVLLNRLCGACLARKSNGIKLAQSCDAVFVIGGLQSSNTRELANWIKQSGKPVYLVENVNSFTPELDREIKKYRVAGVCSGTSTPASIIDAVCKHLDNL